MSQPGLYWVQGHVMRYRGHINQQTIKDVAFVGPDDCAVAAGSDCSRLFLWDRATGVPLELRQVTSSNGNVVMHHHRDTGRML
jgi:WD40 repeat protein